MSASRFKQAVAMVLVAFCAFGVSVPAQSSKRVKKPATQTKTAQPERQDEILYKRGIAFFEGAHYEDAIASFKSLIATYPQSSYADLAYTYTVQSQVKLEQYNDAIDTLGRFRVAFPDSPLGKSLTKEIDNAKLASTARAPAIAVTTDNANPFANAARDAQQNDMKPIDDRSRASSSGGVPPPSSLRRRQSDEITGGQTSAVPPPTGLRNPTPADLNAKGSAKRDAATTAARQSAAPLPTEAAGSDSGQTFNRPRRASSAPVPPPTRLKNPDSSDLSSRIKSSAFEETNLPVAAVQLQLARTSAQGDAGKVVTYPMLIKNSGAIEESYKLGTTLPAGFEAVFVLDENKNGRVEVNELSTQFTPALSPGGSASVILVLRVPKATTGRVDFKITVDSVAQRTSPALAEVTLITAGGDPAVTVDVDFDRTSARRGHTFTYLLKVNNKSDLPVKLVRLNYTFEEGYIFQGAKPAEGIYSNDIRTATWDFPEIGPHSTVSVAIKVGVSKTAEAGNGIIGYGTLHGAGIAPIQIGGAPMTIDDKAAGANAQVAPLFRELKGAPREIVFIPFIIRNTGDHRDAFDVKIEPFGGIVFADVNRDGVYQTTEPSITRTPELDAGKDYQVLVRAEVPSNLGGAQQFPYKLVVSSALDPRITANGTAM